MTDLLRRGFLRGLAVGAAAIAAAPTGKIWQVGAQLVAPEMDTFYKPRSLGPTVGTIESVSIGGVNYAVKAPGQSFHPHQSWWDADSQAWISLEDCTSGDTPHNGHAYHIPGGSGMRREDLGLRKLPGETDAEFRKRVLAVMQPEPHALDASGSVTVSGEDVIKDIEALAQEVIRDDARHRFRPMPEWAFGISGLQLPEIKGKIAV